MRVLLSPEAVVGQSEAKHPISSLFSSNSYRTQLYHGVPLAALPVSCIACDDRDQGVNFDVEHWTTRTLLMVWIRDPWRQVVQFLYLKPQGSLRFYGLDTH